MSGLSTEQVYNALNGLLSSNPTTRSQAEEALAVMGAHGDFAPALVQVLGSNQVPKSIRQYAGVYLKQLIKRRWDPEDADEHVYEGDTEEKVTSGNYQDAQHQQQLSEMQVLSDAHAAYTANQKRLHDMETEVPEASKTTVKSLLPLILADPIAEIRSAAASAIAQISEKELASWPELLPGLLHAFSQRDNLHMVEVCITYHRIFCSFVWNVTLFLDGFFLALHPSFSCPPTFILIPYVSFSSLPLLLFP